MWSLIWHYGLGVVLVGGAIALYLLTSYKQLAIALGVGVALLLVGYNMGERNGRAYMQARWDAAERRAVDLGGKARDDAEAAIPPLPPDPRPRPSAVRRGVCVDSFDRDCR